MISVVIPMYNSRLTIVKAIDSVLNQTRVDIIREIIVVDDGSVDESYSIVKENYKNNDLIHLVSQENGGVAVARNTGIKLATGEWVALLDSDDQWLDDKIEKQWCRIQEDSDIKFIGSNRNEEYIKWGKEVRPNLYSLDLKHILIKVWPHTSTALIKKEVFDEVGLYNERRRYAEDVELWCRIALRYNLYYLYDSLEIAGGYKSQFGESGLSANLYEMHRGNVENIKDLYKNHDISCFFYIFLKLYNYLKYQRRILVTKSIRKKK